MKIINQNRIHWNAVIVLIVFWYLQIVLKEKSIQRKYLQVRSLNLSSFLVKSLLQILPASCSSKWSFSWCCFRLTPFMTESSGWLNKRPRQRQTMPGRTKLAHAHGPTAMKLRQPAELKNFRPSIILEKKNPQSLEGMQIWVHHCHHNHHCHHCHHFHHCHHSHHCHHCHHFLKCLKCSGFF